MVLECDVVIIYLSKMRSWKDIFHECTLFVPNRIKFFAKSAKKIIVKLFF